MGPFPPSHGNNFIFMFHDTFSRYNILVPCLEHTALTVAQLLVERVIAYSGTPVRILSCQRTRIHQPRMASTGESAWLCNGALPLYHPQGNGGAERSHRIINNLIRATTAQAGSDKWVDILPAVQLTMNSAPREECHLSPHQILMGTLVRLPANLHLQRCLRKCHDEIRGAGEVPTYYEQTPSSSLQPRDPILVAVPPLHYWHKFAPKWEGPF